MVAKHGVVRRLVFDSARILRVLTSASWHRVSTSDPWHCVSVALEAAHVNETTWNANVCVLNTCRGGAEGRSNEGFHTLAV